MAHLAARRQIAYSGAMGTKTADKTKNQRALFIEAARKAGADESEAAFDRALGKIARAPAQTPKKATRKIKK